jgi:hypothetical protein
MAKPFIRVHDLEINEVIDREMTAAEFKSYEADQKAQAIIDAEADAKASAKTAILERLGLTADEAKLLLG